MQSEDAVREGVSQKSVAELLKENPDLIFDVNLAHKVSYELCFSSTRRLAAGLGSNPTLEEFLEKCFRYDMSRKEFLVDYIERAKQLEVQPT